MSHPTFDFVVVGAGVVGSAIARQLAGTDHSVAVVDGRNDVCEGTSKANTALCITGFDATPGTLEARLVARGYHLTRDYCERAEIGVLQTGAVLVAWDDEQAAQLPAWQEKAVQNGYLETVLLSPEMVYQELPALGPGVTGGLAVPGESVIDAWSVPLAYATEAVSRGAELFLNHWVTGVDVGDDMTRVTTDRGEIHARWVINAAGLGGDDIDAMYGHDRVHYHARKGELMVFDKLASDLSSKIVLAVPSHKGKGVLISPTIFGNLMVGPTAVDIADKRDTSTTGDGFDFLVSKGRRILPDLMDDEVTAAYAGLRAASDLMDYLIEADAEQRYLLVAGVRSTGLTSALAVAEHVIELLRGTGLEMHERPGLPPAPVMPHLAEHLVRPYQDDTMIAEDPAYGSIVCFCERVTEGEIRDAMISSVPPTEVSGLRRRTRAMNGRCQGFFCGAQVECLFDKHRQDEEQDS